MMGTIDTLQKQRRNLRARLLAGAAAWAVMLGAAAASAQEQPARTAQGSGQQPTQLDAIVVRGAQATTQSATGPVDGYVARDTTAGSKSAAPLKAVPQSVSVIGRQELYDRGVVTKIDEALRYTPGVTTEPFGADPDTDWFYIRGFDATQTGVFLDGLNLFSYGFGGFQTDAYMLERVDVLKGPASVLYGGANPGGIVDLIRKRPQDEALTEVEIGINNFGNAFFGFDVNRKANDAVTYRVTGKVAGGDNYSDYSEDLRGFLMPQITYAPDDATSLTVYAVASSLDQTHVGNGFLPYAGTVVDGPFGGKIDRDFFFGEPDRDSGRYDQQMIGYAFAHEFDNGWKLSQNLRFAHLDKVEELVYPYAYNPVTNDLARLGFRHDTGVESFNVDTRLETTVSTGPLDHALMIGVDYKNVKIDQAQASAFPASDLDPLDPVYGVPLPAYFTYLDGVTRLEQAGLYAQDQIRFGGGWLLTLNGRYDYVDIENRSRLATGSYSTHDGALSGRAGLAYAFDNGLTPYVSVATFFNPQIGTLAGSGGALEPEDGYQVEGGVKYEPTFFDGSLTASVYQIVKQNVTTTYAGPPSFQRQLGEVTSTGFELEGKANLSQNWRMLASYTYNDLEITEDGDAALIGNRPFLVPEQQASLWIEYLVTESALEGISIGGGLRYQGQSFANMTNTLKVPDAVVADAAIRYEKNGWRAALNVANLFDKDYVKSCQGEFTCGYGEQRTVTLKLSKSF